MPNQLGTIARLCIQLNIQGIARMAANPPRLLRLAGRELICMRLNSLIGVACCQ